MPARASPAGFAVPYHFSISITGGFAFGQKRVFMLYIQHVALNIFVVIKSFTSIIKDAKPN